MKTDIKGKIFCQRIYEKEIKTGSHILVDRLWPRGIRKDDARIDEWCRTIAPSSELRKWFSHCEERFDEFSCRYKKELNDNSMSSQFLTHCSQILKEGDLILLYSAKNINFNNAVVLKSWLEQMLS